MYQYTREMAEAFKSRQGKYPFGYKADNPAEPMEEIEEAWKQHDEEVKEQTAPDYDREKETESVDDILRGIAEDFGNPLPKREVPAKPDPAEEIAEAVRKAKAAARPRRPRKAAPARKLPHGGCTGVWI